jgi:ribosomal-protein-alanine N-acetyltransferase
MDAPAGNLVEGIDREWLEAAAHADPVAHAWAVYDLDYAAERVRFVSLRQEGTTTAYLLIWYGPDVPVVHWVGTPLGWPQLFAALPSRPMVAIVPPSVAEPLGDRRGPTERFPIEILARPLSALPPPPRRDRSVRPLRSGDIPQLRQLCEEEPALSRSLYRTVDPGREPVWGAFDGSHLVGVARASVRLPKVWVIGGIYTRVLERGRGWGRALTEEVMSAALSAGAQASLAVRSDNQPALRIYRALGFERVDERVWVDAGAHLTP